VIIARQHEGILMVAMTVMRIQFEDLRRTRKNRRDPIPPQLWEVAVNLSGSHSINPKSALAAGLWKKIVHRENRAYVT